MLEPGNDSLRHFVAKRRIPRPVDGVGRVN